MGAAEVTSAAYLDVDGTLTTGTTLFGFLRYMFEAQARPPDHYVRERRRLRDMTAAGVSREETNRAYYGNLAGLEVSWVQETAENWFRHESNDPDFFNRSVRAELERHRCQRSAIVLVSGSFSALLAPLARDVGADFVICSQPEVVRGRYTGRIAVPMIGPAKADAIRRHLARDGIDPRRCWAYGDHHTDLDILELVGSPVVVGCHDPVLLAAASRRGWSRMT